MIGSKNQGRIILGQVFTTLYNKLTVKPPKTKQHVAFCDTVRKMKFINFTHTADFECKFNKL